MDMKSVINHDTVFRVLDLYANKKYRSFVDPYKQIYNVINVDLCNQKGDIDVDSLKEFIYEVDSDYKKTGLNLETHPLISQTGWLSVRSQEVGKTGYSSNDIDCRLYICLANEDIHKFSSYLYKKYKNSNIPFYFKIAGNESLGRKDNMVIYSSFNNLGKNIEILRSLEKEHPDIISRCEEPSLIVSKVNSWIGYAENLKQDNQQSFTVGVSKCFADGIEQAVIKYLNEHPNDYFSYKNDLVKGSDYLLSKVGYDSKIFSLFKEKYSDDSFKNCIYESIMNYIGKIEFKDKKDNHTSIKREIVKPYLDRKGSSRGDLYPRYDFSLSSIKEAYDSYEVVFDSLGRTNLKKDGIVYSDDFIIDKVKFAYTWINATRCNRSRSDNGSRITDEDCYYAFNDDATQVYNGIMNTVLENNLDIRNMETKNVLKSALTNINYKYSSSIVDGLYASHDSIDIFNKCVNNYREFLSLNKASSHIM